jgi:hypothetical protein
VTPTRERVAPEPRFPHGMCNAATAYASSAGTDMAAYEDLPGYHLLAVRNLIATKMMSRTMAPPANCPPRPHTGTRSGTSPACRTQ